MPSFELLLALAVCLSTVVSFVLFFSPTTYHGAKDNVDASGIARARIQILVLGDIGRSPRMQNHAISIAKHGGFVDLVGYKGKFGCPFNMGKSQRTILTGNSQTRNYIQRLLPSH